MADDEPAAPLSERLFSRGADIDELPTRRLPKLIVFDLDACLWHPEMFQLSAAPTEYDAHLGGVRAGRDVVKLFPGALLVLRLLVSDSRYVQSFADMVRRMLQHRTPYCNTKALSPSLLQRAALATRRSTLQQGTMVATQRSALRRSATGTP
jgi:hypothetical protein